MKEQDKWTPAESSCQGGCPAKSKVIDLKELVCLSPDEVMVGGFMRGHSTLFGGFDC